MVFSMPVWRKPTSGATLITVSPSSSTTSRSTPWVLGWCGPMFSTMVSFLPSSAGPVISWGEGTVKTRSDFSGVTGAVSVAITAS